MKDQLFDQLHGVARRKMFPSGMLEKMLSKPGGKALKIFFKGLARHVRGACRPGLFGVPD